MPRPDPRVDTYIAKAQLFAQPILAYLRTVVHEACPDVAETMRWNFPHFDHRGEMMCSMAAFKAHCTFGFWKGALVLADASRSADAMGDFGRIRSLGDLPSKANLNALIRRAMRLNEKGVKRSALSAPKAKRPPRVPRELAAALAKHPRAAKVFDGFPPSQRREYAEWIAEAKTEATRARRIATTIEWLKEGRQRNWRYVTP
jgi:uncharacterized protein YdeI (YjbR/CyaY-like superfamily)